MNSFRPRSSAYATDHPNTAIVPIHEIAPLDMSARQHLDHEGLDRKRMISVLVDIVEYRPMWPIKMMVWPHKKFKYILADGAHRYFASAAAGFTHIPTIEGWVFEDQRPNQD